MKYRTVKFYAFVVVLLSAFPPGAPAQDLDQNGNGIHKQTLTMAYPHGWKRLHPVHKKANPLAAYRHGSAAVSESQIQGLSQAPQINQPVAQSLPLWEYNIAVNGASYGPGYIVGRNPYYNGHRSTTVQTYLVPVILTFPDGSVFDPTAPDNCIVNPPGDTVMDLVENSPMFLTTDFTFTDKNNQNPVDVGVTQYGDAFERANFWTYVSPNANNILPYHTLLNATALPAVSVSVPPGDGAGQFGGCGPYGVMDYNWWDSYVTNTLIPSLAPEGVGPSNLPIFIFDSVVMYLNGDRAQCCAIGDHGSYNPNGAFQTYAVADFDTSGAFAGDPDIMTLSHEIGEWMDDPDNGNPTPPWGHVGQETGCSNILEVGDALTEYVFSVSMPNNVAYSPQELVFFSWFYGQTPSIGAGGWYSDQGTFTSPAAPCSGAIVN